MTVSTLRGAHRAWVEVDLAALAANARAIRAAARGAALLPMVKADGYGLGAVPVARALEGLDPWGYGVATVEEGIELREAGIRRPLLVLTPASLAFQDVYREHSLTAVVDDPVVAAGWNGSYHVEVDTGMGRCGVPWDGADALARFRSPHLEGAFTHFYAADADPESVELQWDRFRRALAALGSRPRLVHAANSAAALRLRERLDLVRPGIFLYGGAAGAGLPLPRPVAALRAPVVSLRRVAAGATVSYGAEWTAPRPTVVATLAVGYADGVPRAVQGRAHVLLGGRRCPVVGRVTMDFLMVDVGAGGHTDVQVGDVATLIGSDRGGEITVDEFAAWAGTISYEVLVRLGRRLHRRYRGA